MRRRPASSAPSRAPDRGGARARSARLAAGLAALLLGGCTFRTPLEDAPCPCVDGYVCCPALQRCVPEGTGLCPAGPAGDAAVPPDGGPARDGAVPPDGGPARDAASTDGEPARDGAVPPDAAGDAGPGPVDPPDAADPGDGPLLVDETPAALLEAAPRGAGLAAHDFDGDGRPDVLFMRGVVDDSRGPLYLNAGGLDLRPAPPPPWVSAFGRADGAVPVEVTGDGRVDLVVSGYVESLADGFPLVILLEGLADGGFRESVAGPLLSIAERLVDMTAVDLEGDGAHELVACRFDDRRGPDDARLVAVLATGPDGLHEVEGRVTLDAGRLGKELDCLQTAVGDPDRDGDADLAICGRFLTFFENVDGAWIDRSADQGLPASLNPGCRTLDWVDHDSDGDLDLAALFDDRGGHVGVRVWRNDGGRLRPEQPLARDGAGIGDGEAAVGDVGRSVPGAVLRGGAGTGAWTDVDHDGDLDLFLPQPLALQARVPILYVQRRAGNRATFDAHPISMIGVLNVPTGVVAEDLDLDGDPDLVVHAWDLRPNRPAVFRNRLRERGAPDHRFLVVRVLLERDGAVVDAWGVPVEVDLDGPDDAPDFAVGHGRLQVRMITGRSRSSHGLPRARFGLGDRADPVWVRARFADGCDVTRRVDAFDRTLEIRRPVGACP